MKVIRLSQVCPDCRRDALEATLDMARSLTWTARTTLTQDDKRFGDLDALIEALSQPYSNGRGKRAALRLAVQLDAMAGRAQQHARRIRAAARGRRS